MIRKQYAVHPGIDRGSGVLCGAASGGIEEPASLREMVPGGRLAIAHGQMDESELEPTMLTFSNGEADILVCTTIESGLTSRESIPF